MSRIGDLVSRDGAGFVVLLAFFVAASVVAGLGDSPPSPEEAAYRLAAESLIRDADMRFGIEDENRMRLRAWPEGIRPPMLIDDSGRVSFEGPWFFPVLLAPLQPLLGRLTPVVLNGLLILAAALVTARSMKSRSGESEYWKITMCIFGSVLFAYQSANLPVALLVFATASALALFTTETTGAFDEIPDLYQEQPATRRRLARFLVAGLLLGVVAAHHPAYLLLLLAPLGLTGREDRLAAVGSAAGAALIVLAICWGSSGLWTEQGLIPGDEKRVEVSVGSGVTGVEKSEVAEPQGPLVGLGSPSLLTWNVVYAMVGRHVGLLPYFLPIALLVGGWRPGFGRGALVALAGAGLLASLLLDPFDFAGLPSALGNRVFVPFFVLLWWLPTRSIRGALGVVAIASGVLVLWPLWIPGSTALHRLERGEFPDGPVLDLLPFETTQRDLPVRGEVVTRDLLVRPEAGLDPAGRRGHFVLPMGRQGELVIASARSVRNLEVVFDASAASRLEVSGGEVGNTTLTPDGGVAFEIRLDDGLIRHPVWWDEQEYSFHRLRLRMPEARGSTVFSIGAGR